MKVIKTILVWILYGLIPYHSQSQSMRLSFDIISSKKTDNTVAADIHIVGIVDSGQIRTDTNTDLRDFVCGTGAVALTLEVLQADCFGRYGSDCMPDMIERMPTYKSFSKNDSVVYKFRFTDRIHTRLSRINVCRIKVSLSYFGEDEKIHKSESRWQYYTLDFRKL